jgi:nicotinamide phosphoribosyltransferase
MKNNIIKLTDSYKVSHWKQYPSDTTGIFSFFESRGGKFQETTFFGLQYYLKEYLEGVVVTEEAITEAREYFHKHFGDDTLFNEDGWRYILEEHGGKLPVIIKAVPEGTSVPTSNVLMTIENTDPKVPWITNYLETLLSQIWYPTTVCTQSREMKKVIEYYLHKTGDASLIDFKLHDFGFRGSTSTESAGIGGAAHLVNFMGTDTLAGIDTARDYYEEDMAGFSIPAAEHSTITSWGKQNEEAVYEHMLDTFPTGLVAVVSDSYNIFKACKDIWGDSLREKVLSRDGTLVIRPDSGDPCKVNLEILESLSKAFGSYINDKGYEVLNDKVRVIQGDGIDYEMLDKILNALEIEGWSADNIAFGSGGGLLQKVDRDTQRFAFKCSAMCDGNGWRGVMKDPVTDHSKRSKAGRLVLVKDNDSYKTLDENDTKLPNILETVFKDGEIIKETTLSEIRGKANL